MGGEVGVGAVELIGFSGVDMAMIDVHFEVVMKVWLGISVTQETGYQMFELYSENESCSRE